MKPKGSIVLLVDADADTAGTAVEAASLLNLDVRCARTSADLFQMLHSGLGDIAVVVLDLDPGVHGMAVLEALDGLRLAPPLIVLSSLEESYVYPIAIAHGAMECFGKPISRERLKTSIEKLSRAREERICRCDEWGHPCKGHRESRGDNKEREHAFSVHERQRKSV